MGWRGLLSVRFRLWGGYENGLGIWFAMVYLLFFVGVANGFYCTRSSV